MLKVKFGNMRSGKSMAALIEAYQVEQLGRPLLMLTYEQGRSHQEKVVESRIGIKRTCYTYDNKTNIPALLSEVLSPENLEKPTIIVDECQFASLELAQQLHQVSVNYTVSCYGLRVAANGLPFEGMAALLSYADKIDSIDTACQCSPDRLATMHVMYENGQRVKNPPTIKIGDVQYGSVCSRCFYNEER